MKEKFPIILIIIGVVIIAVSVFVHIATHPGDDPTDTPAGTAETTVPATPDTTPDTATSTTEPDTSTTPEASTGPDVTTTPEESTTEPVETQAPSAKATVSDKTMVGTSIATLFDDPGLKETYDSLFFYTQNLITVHVKDAQGKDAANVTVKLMGHREGGNKTIVLAEQRTNSKGIANLCYNYGFIPTTIESGDVKIDYADGTVEYQMSVQSGVSYDKTAYIFSLYETDSQTKYRMVTYPALTRFIADKDGSLCGYNYYGNYKPSSISAIISPVEVDDDFRIIYQTGLLDVGEEIDTANTKLAIQLLQVNVQKDCENIAIIVMDGEQMLNTQTDMDKIFIYAVRDLAEHGVRVIPVIMPDATDRTKVFAYTMAAMTNAPYIEVKSVDEMANIDIALNEAVNMLHAK